MKLFPAKCHERATLRKLSRQTGNSSLLPGQQFTVDHCCTWWLESQCGFQILLYNKSLNDWSLGEQWILFPSNLNVALDFVSGNIEILGKQNSLFPSGPVIKCLIFTSKIWSDSTNHFFCTAKSLHGNVLITTKLSTFTAISLCSCFKTTTVVSRCILGIQNTFNPFLIPTTASSYSFKLPNRYNFALLCMLGTQRFGMYITSIIC